METGCRAGEGEEAGVRGSVKRRTQGMLSVLVSVSRSLSLPGQNRSGPCGLSRTCSHVSPPQEATACRNTSTEGLNGAACHPRVCKHALAATRTASYIAAHLQYTLQRVSAHGPDCDVQALEVSQALQAGCA
jgi:hypothetical protein